MEPRTLVHALLGAGVAALESTSTVIDALAARGEAVKRQRRARIERRLDRTGRALARLRDHAAETAELALQGVWQTFNVPTRHDVAELARRIEALQREIERLGGR